MCVGGQRHSPADLPRHSPAALPPELTRYPMYRRQVVLVWTIAENLAPSEFDPLTSQPILSRYTDWVQVGLKHFFKCVASKTFKEAHFLKCVIVY